MCGFLQPTEIANFRLLHREIATIGIQYIVSELIMLLKEESFQKLESVSKHPVISKYVRSIFWEAGSLPSVPRCVWEDMIRSNMNRLVSKEPLLGTYGNPLETFQKSPHRQCSKAQLDKAFAKYNAYFLEQERIRTSCDYTERMANAMGRLPRLRELSVSTDYSWSGFGNRLVRERKAFGAGLCRLSEGFGLNSPWGTTQARCLLLGAHRAGVQLDKFQCSCVDWTLLKQSEEAFAALKSAIISVRHLDLLFTFDQDDSVLMCAGFFVSGRLQDFVTSAPLLNSLSIQFEWGENRCPTDLNSVAGHFIWSQLRVVHLEGIKATHDELLRFLSRHANILKVLNLGNIHLTDGEWSSTFQKMRLTLKLLELDLSGCFDGHDDSGQSWFLTDKKNNTKIEPPTLKSCVEEFVLGKGECETIEAYLRQRGVA